MGFLPDTPRNHTTAFMSELAGTFMFLFFAFAIAQVANTPPPTSPSSAPNILAIFFIALGFGCSVAVNVWLYYRVSGGMFNPAVSLSRSCRSTIPRALTSNEVTLTLYLVGAIPASRGCIVFVAQMLGGIAAAGAVSALLPGPMAVNVRLGGGCSATRGVFIEMFTTVQLVFTVIMLAAVKHKATFLAPFGIGIALFIGHLASRSLQSYNILVYLAHWSRHLLHWRGYQPSSSIWTRRCLSQLPKVSLDLLGRTFTGFSCFSSIFLHSGSFRLENSKSRPRLG